MHKCMMMQTDVQIYETNICRMHGCRRLAQLRRCADECMNGRHSNPKKKTFLLLFKLFCKHLTELIFLSDCVLVWNVNTSGTSVVIVMNKNSSSQKLFSIHAKQMDEENIEAHALSIEFCTVLSIKSFNHFMLMDVWFQDYLPPLSTPSLSIRSIETRADGMDV